MTEPMIQRGEALSPYINFFSSGSQVQQRVGLEFELIGYTLPDWRRLTPALVERIVEGFASQSTGIKAEGDFIIEVELNTGRITLEPGGQIEFSGNPSSRLTQLHEELTAFLTRLCELADEHGLAFLACGFDPLCNLSQQQWIPKQRYRVMRPYLRQRGELAESMMTQTAAIQCSVDYDSIENLIKKFVVTNRLGPVVAAMCANSPFTEARPNGYASYRYQVWLKTDPDRCGIPEVASLSNLGIEQILKYILDVPMMFEIRDGAYAAAGTKRFREHTCEHHCVEFCPRDFALHLTEIFTDARLKPYVEIRSADSSQEYPLAVAAFWMGLLYNEHALDEALRIAPKLSPTKYKILQTEVARHGLRAKTEDVDVLRVARQIVEVADYGMKWVDPDESASLSILKERLTEGIAPADILIRNYHGGWRREIAPVLEALRIA